MEAIAEKAKETGTGARALRMIVENLLRKLMFEVPSDPTVQEILIEKETVQGKKSLLLNEKKNKDLQIFCVYSSSSTSSI